MHSMAMSVVSPSPRTPAGTMHSMAMPVVSPSPPLISCLLEDSSSTLLQLQDIAPKSRIDAAQQVQQIQKKVQCGAYRIVLRKTRDDKRKSIIWDSCGEIFDMDGNVIPEHVACSKCQKVYKFLPHKTGTSNILKHRCQPLSPLMSASEPLRERMRRKKEGSAPRKEKSSGAGTATPSAGPSEATHRQLRCISDTLSKEAACFACTDLVPVKAVSSPGLRNLLQTCVDLGVKYGQFEIKESLLATAGLGQRIKTMATECRRKLAVELKGLLANIGASLSLQTWKVAATKSEHLVMTLHSMNNFTKVTRCLRMAEFDDEYLSCENMLSVLYQTLKDYDLHDYFHRLVYVTDQNSKLVTALGTATRLNCVASAINSALENTMHGHAIQVNPCQVNSLQGSNDIIAEIHYLWNFCITLVSHLERAGLQDLLDEPIYRPRDASSWVNRVDFLQNILNQWIQITNALRTIDEEVQYASPINISMLEEIINFVTPFRQAIKELSDQQKPTLYLVVVWYTRLVQEMQPENTDSLLINALKAEARTQLLHMEVHQLHRIALFLHPKLKSLKLLQDDSLKLSVQAEVRSMLSAQVINSYMEANGSQNQSMTLHKASPSGCARRNTHTLSDLEDTSDDDGSSFDSDEVNKYLMLRVSKTNSEFDLLKWWTAHELDLPRLSRVAQFIHSIPASHKSQVALSPALTECPELADDMLLLKTCMM